jgi:peptidoglycan LD-endopeptidase LytH
MDTPPPTADRPTATTRRPRAVVLLGGCLLLAAVVVGGLALWGPSRGTTGEETSPVAAAPQAREHVEEESPSTRKTAPPAPGSPAPEGDSSEDRATDAPEDDPTAPPGADPAPSAATYAFPVEPAGAASYGRDHHTYPATDVFAACGTQLVAITDGVVDEAGDTDEWDPGVDDPATRSGRYVSIVGDDGVRYYLSHLESVEPGVRAGARVSAGQPIGTVGRSGNARSTPCHAHFGISPPLGPGDWEVRRGVIWPWPYLDAWRAGRDESPAEEVAAWSP